MQHETHGMITRSKRACQLVLLGALVYLRLELTRKKHYPLRTPLRKLHGGLFPSEQTGENVEHTTGGFETQGLSPSGDIIIAQFPSYHHDMGDRPRLFMRVIVPNEYVMPRKLRQRLLKRLQHFAGGGIGYASFKGTAEADIGTVKAIHNSSYPFRGPSEDKKTGPFQKVLNTFNRSKSREALYKWLTESAKCNCPGNCREQKHLLC